MTSTIKGTGTQGHSQAKNQRTYKESIAGDQKQYKQQSESRDISRNWECKHGQTLCSNKSYTKAQSRNWLFGTIKERPRIMKPN